MCKIGSNAIIQFRNNCQKSLDHRHYRFDFNQIFTLISNPFIYFQLKSRHFLSLWFSWLSLYVFKTIFVNTGLAVGKNRVAEYAELVY